MPLRGLEWKPTDKSAERRREMREEVVDGSAEIAGKTYPVKNWSPNGFCIGPTDLAPEPGDRLDISFTIPLPEHTLSFRCRTGIMRHDPEQQEIGGVFFDVPEDIEELIEEHFDIQAPKGYGITLFQKLRVAVGAPGDMQMAKKPPKRATVVDINDAAPDENAAGMAPDDRETSPTHDLCRQAAEAGCADNQALLGFSYFMGEGVAQDNVQAKMWLTLAAAQGHEEAVVGCDMVVKQMTPEQLAEADHRANEWLGTGRQAG